jgi:hypothetical protein
MTSGDGLSVLLVWLTCVVLSLFVEPNYDNRAVPELLYYSVYEVAVGWLIGFHLFDRLAPRSVRFIALSCLLIASGTLVNEGVVEPLVFGAGPINFEGLYYGVLGSATTATLFLLLRMARLLRASKENATQAGAGALPSTGSVSPPALATDNEDCFFVRVADETRRIRAADVIYMKAERDFTHIVCSSGSHFASESLKGLLERSSRFGLVRAHKSFAVNLGRVDRLTRTEAGLGDQKVPVGRRYWPVLADTWRQSRSPAPAGQAEPCF